MASGKKDDYSSPYRRAAARFGAGFPATMWKTREAQILRFDVMIDMVDFEGASILDAGCGAGDFAARIAERGVRYARFIGVDGVSQQISMARGLALERTQFQVGDFVNDESVFRESEPDYICFSGSLNTMDTATVRRVLRRAFAAARRAVVFNFLSDRHHSDVDPRILGPAYRFNAVETIDFALTLSPLIRLRHDYLDGHDATLVIEKG